MQHRNADVFGARKPLRAWLSATALALLLSAPVSAHKTFLASGQHMWATGDTVEVGLTSALEFPNIESGPRLDRISFTSVSVANAPVEDLAFREGAAALTLSFQAHESGFSVVAMSTHPRAGEISPENTAAYLDEIEASPAVRQAFEDLPGSPALNRSYSKHTKTFLCIDTCDVGEEAGEAPLGQALEFVSVRGEDRAFALFRDGQSVANQRVTIYSSDGEHTAETTDQDGVVHVNSDFTGVVLLSAIWVTAPDHPSGNYHSDQATLTTRLD